MVDVRVLRYFLTVAREESFSRAAEALHLSQPTLSRQIRDMEEELGAQLLIRTNRNVILTPEGHRLRRRAQEIVELMERTQQEFGSAEDGITGDVCIGCGETQIMREIARVMIPLQRGAPGIRFRLYSGNGDDVLERLDKGLLDFGLLFEPGDLKRYDTLLLPFADTVGFLMQETHPLAQRDRLRIDDVYGVPLLVPSQGQSAPSSSALFNRQYDADRLNIVCHYNLLFNAAVMVEQGMGIALCLDHLADTTEHTGLTFRPLDPPAQSRLWLAWKKHQILSPVAALFLQRVRQRFEQNER